QQGAPEDEGHVAQHVLPGEEGAVEQTDQGARQPGGSAGLRRALRLFLLLSAWLVHVLSAILNRALRARGFVASSSSVGRTGLPIEGLKGRWRLPRRSFTSRPPRSPVRIQFFTRRSSRLW